MGLRRVSVQKAMRALAMLTYLLIAAALLTVIVLSILHAPRWLSYSLMRAVPVWVQAIGVHLFGYLVGGVTGHVVGALMSLPYYYLARHWLKPTILGTPSTRSDGLLSLPWVFINK